MAAVFFISNMKNIFHYTIRSGDEETSATTNATFFWGCERDLMIRSDCEKWKTKIEKGKIDGKFMELDTNQFEWH